MALSLVFLGRLADTAGGPEREVAAAASIDELLAMLEPDLAAALRSDKVRVAVNGEIVLAHHDHRLQDGDEVAFLPPVSGG